MMNAMIRPPQVTTSSGCVGSTTASNSAAPSVAATAAVPRASDPVSRSAATRTSVPPMIASVVGVSASGSSPPLMCTSARRHANAIASITARATRSAAKARELDRRTSLPLSEDVVRHPVDHQVRAERGGYVAHADDQDAMVRATKRDRRVGEALAEPRGDDHERRAPRQAAALAKKHRFRRAHGIRAEAREDLEASGERSRPATKRGPGPLVREVVDAVRHEPDLPAGPSREAHELSGSGDDELGGLGVGLYPVLLVRGDVDEEDRVEARRRLVELRLKLAETRRRLPVDLFSRVTTAVRPDATETKRVRHQPPARGGLCERAKRRERAVAHRERCRVRDDLGGDRYGALGLREPEPVAAAQAQRADRVRAASRNAHREAHHDALPTPYGEATVDPAAGRAGRGIRWLDAFAEKETRLDPRQRYGFAVDDLDRGDRKLAGDDPIRSEGDARVHGGEREA